MARCNGTKNDGTRCTREIDGELCWQHEDTEDGASCPVPRGRTCTVCAHAERETIDREIVAGGRNRAIARRYGLEKDAVRRHRDGHLPETLARAQDAAEIAHADGLLDEVRDLQERTLAILSKAEASGDPDTALKAIREARRNVELLARLLGELDETPQVNVLLAPEWIEVRAVMLAALAPFPDARAAVGGALQRIEEE